MAAETLATFRISKEKWQRFQKMAKDHGTYASALLKQFIHSYLAGDESRIGNNIDTNLDIEPLIDSCIESRLAQLLTELEGMQNYVQSLESRLDARIDKLEAQPPASLPVEMEAGNDEINAELSELRSAM